MRGIARGALVLGCCSFPVGGALGQEPGQRPGRVPQAALRQPVPTGQRQVPAPTIGRPAFDDRAAAGLSANSKVYTLALKDAYTLALIRARSGTVRLDDGAAALEPARLAEQAQRFGAADFARFRADFLGVSAAADGSTRVFVDPGPRFMAVLAKLHAVESASGRVDSLQPQLTLMSGSMGGGSGISQADVDRMRTLQSDAHIEYLEERLRYRRELDELKLELGLPPSLAVIPDRAILDAFARAFATLELWIHTDQRDPLELPALIAKLPKLGDIVINGQPLLAARPGQSLDEVIAAATQLSRANPSAKRALEDSDGRELELRRAMQELQTLRAMHPVEEERLRLAYKEADRALDALRSPPSAADHSVSVTMDRTVKLYRDEGAIARAEHRLVERWVAYQRARLELYRGLGILPFGDWASFEASFTTPNP
jgi:hypothetical protein